MAARFIPPHPTCTGLLRCSSSSSGSRAARPTRLRCTAAYAPGLGSSAPNGASSAHRQRSHELTVSSGGPLPVLLSGAGGAAVAAAIEGAAKSGAGELRNARLRWLACACYARITLINLLWAQPKLGALTSTCAAPSITINVYAADPAAAVAPPGEAVPVKAVLSPPEVYAAVSPGCRRRVMKCLLCLVRKSAALHLAVSKQLCPLPCFFCHCAVRQDGRLQGQPAGLEEPDARCRCRLLHRHVWVRAAHVRCHLCLLLACTAC